MSTAALATAPVLSTPDTHIFEDPTPAIDTSSLPRLDDVQLAVTYEIERTVKEIRESRWRRIALQFPDSMLADAPRVYEQLRRGLGRKSSEQAAVGKDTATATAVDEIAKTLDDTTIDKEAEEQPGPLILSQSKQLTIIGLE